MPARCGAIGLTEAVEYERQKFRAHAFARVTHTEQDTGFYAPEGDGYAPSHGRELHGVREQISHHLLESCRVAYERTHIV